MLPPCSISRSSTSHPAAMRDIFPARRGVCALIERRPATPAERFLPQAAAPLFLVVYHLAAVGCMPFLRLKMPPVGNRNHDPCPGIFNNVKLVTKSEPPDAQKKKTIISRKYGNFQFCIFHPAPERKGIKYAEREVHRADPSKSSY